MRISLVVLAFVVSICVLSGTDAKGTGTNHRTIEGMVDEARENALQATANLRSAKESAEQARRIGTLSTGHMTDLETSLANAEMNSLSAQKELDDALDLAKKVYQRRAIQRQRLLQIEDPDEDVDAPETTLPATTTETTASEATQPIDTNDPDIPDPVGCALNPCENDGECVDGVEDGSFSCICADGFIGATCAEATTCHNRCGADLAEDGAQCSCDWLCTYTGDCCDDYADSCGGSCASRCGTDWTQYGYLDSTPYTCSCDVACKTAADELGSGVDENLCCEDYDDYCPECGGYNEQYGPDHVPGHLCYMETCVCETWHAQIPYIGLDRCCEPGNWIGYCITIASYCASDAAAPDNFCDMEPVMNQTECFQSVDEVL